MLYRRRIGNLVHDKLSIRITSNPNEHGICGADNTTIICITHDSLSYQIGRCNYCREESST
jgi:hypothetical protein